MHKGWIALDIDGTITDLLDGIPQEVIAYLEDLDKKGWKILFITGRSYSFGHKVLQTFSMPYFFAVQHGADILKMPGTSFFSRSYLSHKVIDLLEEVYVGQQEDFLVYAGYEKGDFCYWRPERFSKKVLGYIELIQKLCVEPWKAVKSFDFSPNTQFPLIKCVGTFEEMRKIYDKLKSYAQLHVTMIKDPISRELYLVLVTDAHATKGEALKRILAAHKEKGKVIAAGDDQNDISMLQVADVAIAMETGPDELKACANIIASPASEYGIIKALERAIV